MTSSTAAESRASSWGVRRVGTYRAQQVRVQHPDPESHCDHDSGLGPWVGLRGGAVGLVVGQVLLGECDEVVEQCRRPGRSVDQSSCDITHYVCGALVYPVHVGRVGNSLLVDALRDDLPQVLEDVVVARVAQSLLVAEVVRDKARGDVGLLGDGADGGSRGTLIGEQAHRRIPYPGASGEIAGWTHGQHTSRMTSSLVKCSMLMVDRCKPPLRPPPPHR